MLCYYAECLYAALLCSVSLCSVIMQNAVITVCGSTEWKKKKKIQKIQKRIFVFFEPPALTQKVWFRLRRPNQHPNYLKTFFLRNGSILGVSCAPVQVLKQ